MSAADQNFRQSYESSQYDSSLESSPAIPVTEAPIAVDRRPTKRSFSNLNYSGGALKVSAIAVALIALFGIGGFALSGLHPSGSAKNNASPSANYKVTSLPVAGIKDSQLQIGTADKLAINGQLQVNNGLVLAPSTQPTSPVAGQIYYDQTTKAPYYYNGGAFVSLAPTAIPEHITSLGGAAGVLALGDGLQVSGNTVSVASSLLQSVSRALNSAGVSSLQGLSGAVSLVGGHGISISGTTITNGGVVALTSGSSAVTITHDASGNYSLSYNGVASLAAGSPNLTITNDGSGGYTIVDSGANSPQVDLGPASAQPDTTGNTSVSINKTSSGNFIDFASNGTSTFVVDQTGHILSGTINYSQVQGAPATTVTSIGGASGAISVGSGLSLSGSTLSNSGVTSLNGTANQVTVSAGTGVVTISLPQDIAPSSSPTFTNETLSGGLTAVTASISGNLSVSGSGTFSTGTGSVTLGALGAGIVQSSGAGLLSSGAIDRNSAADFSGTLNTANGGTGTGSFTSGGLIYGNGSGALLSTAAGLSGQLVVVNGSNVPAYATLSGDASIGATGVLSVNKIQNNPVTIATPASGQVLVYNGSAFINSLLTNSSLVPGTFSNITGLGALNAGSITTGFGSINTTANITTNAVIQGNIVNVTGAGAALELNGSDINTAGTLGNVAYLNQANTFSAGNNTFGGTVQIKGAGGLTLGNPGAVGGVLSLTTSTNSQVVLFQTQAVNGGAGNATVELPQLSGGVTDQVCLLTLANCVGKGGAVSTSGGTQNRITKYTNAAGTQIGNSLLFDDGTFVGVNTTTNNGQLSVVASGLQSSLYLQGAASGSNAVAVIKGGGGTGDLLDLENSLGAVLTSVDQNGNFSAVNGSFSGTLAASGLSTFGGGAVVGGTGTASGTANTFTNNGSTLLTGVNIANLPTGGTIGSAATTVDSATTFNVSQTTAGQVVTLPLPTNTTAGRIVYVNNIGTTSFTMYGSVIATGTGASFEYAGSGAGWIAQNLAAAGTGLTQSGNIISSSAPTSITNDTNIQGAISSNVLTLSFAGTLSVDRGGTGSGALTQFGIVYGNDTGALGVTAVGTSGQCLVGNTAAAATWQSCSIAAAGATPGGPAGGDLTGTYPNPTIAKLQGTTLTISSITSGQILQYNGSAVVNNTVSGDITIDGSGVTTIGAGAVTGTKIASSTITNGNLQTGAFGNITAVGTLTGLAVSGATSLNGLTNGASTATVGLVNTGSTLNSSVAIPNLPTGGNIGASAATTVDAATTFDVNQTTSGQTLTLFAPTTTTSGRLVYLNNVGTASFTAYGAIIQVGQGAAFAWNGSAWTLLNNAAVGSGLTQSGNTISSSAATSVNNDTNIQGSISGNVLTLSFAGVLSVARGGTGAATAAGALTNLGAAASGANSDITSLSGVTAVANSSGSLSVGNSAQALTLQGNASTVLGATAAGFTTTVGFVAPTANVTYQFDTAPAGTYTICTKSGNCDGSGSSVTQSGTSKAGYLSKFDSENDITKSLIYDTGSGLGIGTTTPGAFLLNVQGGNVNFGGTATISTGLTVSAGGANVTGNSSFAGNIAQSGAGTFSSGTGNVSLNGNTGVTGTSTFTVGSGASSLGGSLNVTGATTLSSTLGVTGNGTFGGGLSVQGANLTIGTATQQGSIILNAGNTFTASLQIPSTLAQNSTYTLPDPAAAGDTICLKVLGNCAGSGTGVTASSPGTVGHISKFTGPQAIADSTLTESGSTLTASGNVVIQGANSLSLGVSSSSDGSVSFNNSLGTHTVSLQAPSSDPATNLTFKLPSAYGGNGSCLISDGAGGLTFQSCTGGAGGGVTSLDAQTGTLSLANSTGSSSVITINNAKADGSTKGIATFTASQFSDLAGVISLSTVAVGSGGTGLSTAPANGQLLIGNGTGYQLSTLTNSDGTVSIANGPGSISISVPRADQCATCADYTLSNLSDIVAINKSLLPAAAGNIDIGGPAVSYRYLYIAGDSATPGSNNFKLTGTSTGGLRTITLPDTSGTVCLDSNNCNYVNLQVGTPGTAQTGNLNLGGTIIAGTSINSGGTLAVTGATTLSGGLTVSTITSAAATNLSITPAANQTLTLGGTGVGQSTLIQGNAISFKSGNGASAINFNFGTTTETAGGTYQICDNSGNCAGAGGGVTTAGGTSGKLAKFNGAQTLTNSIFSDDGTTGTVAGPLSITGSSITGTGALSVGSTGGTNALTLNSGSGTVALGGTTSTIQRAGTALTFDVNAASTSTLTITNSNVSNVANLSVEGGVNIGAGQAYQINGASINTAGTLNNVAYLNANNAFTGSGTTSFGGALTTVGNINGQTISSAAALTGTLSVAGANALTLGQASTNSGAIVFQNLGGANNVTLKASDTNPAASFTLTLPSAVGNSGDCLKQTDASGGLGFVSCSSGLGGSGTIGKIPVFTGAAAIGDSLLSQSGSVVSLQGTTNAFTVEGSVNVGLNGASGAVGTVNFLDGSNPGRIVGVQAQQAGSSYTLQLPTTSDVGFTCLQLVNVSAGVNKIVGGNCAAGGSGGNVTASGTANGHLLRFTSDGPSYSAASSLIQDDSTGVGVNIAPQTGYILSVGSGSKFKVTDAGQLEVGTTGSSPLTLATNGNISNVGTLTASGLLSTSAAATALTLSGAPANVATQSLARLGGAIVGGNSSASGGTYLGINEPLSGAGSVADFLNFQNNGTLKLKVDTSGNITSGTINGLSLAQAAGQFTVTGGTGTPMSLSVTGNSTINQDLSTTSNSVQFGTLALTNKLAPAQGGTGADTSTALAGAALIFNATTGKFDANRITSSDNSLTVTPSDGHIDLTVASCTSCANSSLSNLGITNLNASLLAQAAVDLGSATQAFRNLYIYGASGTPSANNFKLTGTSTGGLRTITLPDTSGTVCLDSNNCNYVNLQVGTPGTAQTGNLNLGGTIIAGTSINSGGTLAVTGATTLSGGLTVSTITSAAATNLSITPAANQTLTLGGTGASQTTTVQGSSVSIINGDDTLTFENVAGVNSYQVCTSHGNCAGAGGGLVGSGSNNQLAKFTGSNTLASSILNDDGTTVSVAGNLAVNATSVSGNSVAYSNTSLTANNANLQFLSFKNANTTATATTVNGLNITAAGSAGGTNVINSINLGSVATLAGNAFYAFNVGGGYNDILRYSGTQLISGAGFVQNAAIDSSLTYSNLQKVGVLNVGSIANGFGSISTGSNIQTTALVQGGTLNAGSTQQFQVDASGNITTSGTLAVNGNTLSSSSPSFTLLGAPTTVTAFAAATTLNLATSAASTALVSVGSAGGATINSGGVLAINTASAAAQNSITLQPGTNSTATGVGGNLTLKAGDESGNTNGTGGSVTIQAGNATGTGTRLGGNIAIDAGTGATNGTISLGATNAASIALGRSGITTTNSGALTAVQLLTGQAGLAVSGAATNINASSNFVTNINTGSSTGAVNIGNNGASNGTIILQNSTNAIALSGTGTTITGSLTLNAGATVAAQQTINFVGGTTAQRPASPTTGMLYFDNSTNQLLQYNGTKWVSDHSSNTKIVAPSNATQAQKDAADYVATGTGDQATINTALTAAAGGSVYLIEGTYNLTAAISVPNNTTLTGAGNGTLITIPNAQNGSYNLIQVSSNATLKNFLVDGNKVNQTSGGMIGIFISSTNSRIDGVVIQNVFGSGNSGAGLEATGSTGIIISKVTSLNNGGHGVWIGGNSSNASLTNNLTQGNGGNGIYISLTTDGTVSGNVSTSNTGDGIALAVTATGNTVTGNTVQSNTNGIRVSSNYNAITGNTAVGNANSGIFLMGGSNNTVSGNKVHDNGGSTNNNGVYLSSATNNTINGNDITDTSCTTTCYAINISDSGSTGNYVANNHYTGASINDAATNTIYANQLNSTGQLINSSTGALVAKLQSGATNDLFQIQNASGTPLDKFDYQGNLTAVAGTFSGALTVTSASNSAFTGTVSGANATSNNQFVTLGQLNGAVQTVGAIDGGTYSANGASIVGNTIYLQTASATQTGLVNTAAQTFAGAKTFTSQVALSAGVQVAAQQTINFVGGTTAQRPASPTTGMLYFDNSTNQLLQYNGTKWVSDHSSNTKIVAPSNATQAQKDAADYVATGTGDQATINTALTAAAGGSVYLIEGTYNLTAAISVPNNTTLTGAGNGTLITIPNAQNSTYNLIQNTDTTTGTGVTIENLRLDGNNSNQTSGVMNGIYFNGMGSSGSVRPGGKILNVSVNNIYGGNSYGIYLNSSSNNTLIGNTSQLGYYYGIYLNASNNNALTNNAILGNNGGLYLNSSSNNTVTGNNVQGSTNDGIQLSSSTNNTFTSNTVQSNYNGIDVNTSSVTNTVTGNTINGNSNYGIDVLSSSNNAITGNTVQSNFGKGVYLSSALSNVIGSNKVHDNGSSTDNNGIYLASASKTNTITGNDITDTSCSTTCYAINIFDSGSTGNYLGDNHYTGDGTHTASINDASTSTVYANQLNSTGQLINSSTGALVAKLQSGATNDLFQIQNASGTPLDKFDYQGNLTVSAGLNVGSTNQFQVSNSGAVNLYGGPLTVNNNYGIDINGAPNTPYSTALLQMGGALVGSNAVTNGGTYYGINEPGSGLGSAADFLNFQTNGTSQLNVTNNGNITTAGSLTAKNGALVKTTTNSTTAFQVQNAGNATILSVDTTANQLTVNGNLNLTVTAAPTTAPTVALGAAGSLTGTYYYVVSYVTAGGETSYGPVSASISPSSQQVNLTAIPTSPSSLVTVRNIYRGTSNGGPFNSVGTLNDNTTTIFTDNNTSPGAAASDINRAGGLVLQGATPILVNDSTNGNLGVGAHALQANTTGYGNTASGSQALVSNTTGNYNTASGIHSLQSNTTGSQNTASGLFALFSNTTGNFNTAAGDGALQSNTTGSQNTAFGQGALQSNTTGSKNTATGFNAGFQDINGNFKTLAVLQNATAIGAFAQVQENNALVLGSVDNATNVGIGTTVPLNTFSVSPVDLDSNFITASQTSGSGTITSSAAIFSANNVGEQFIWADGTAETVTAFTDTTHITGSSTTTTETTQFFRTHHLGLQVTSGGNVGIGNSAPSALFGVGSASQFQINTSGNVTTSGTLAVNNTVTITANSASSLLIQNASSVALLNADTNAMKITVGTGANTIVLDPANGITATGTARHTKTITLPAEYAGAVLDAASDTTGPVNCSTANSGTMTSGFATATGLANPYENYYSWNSTNASTQCYDVVVQIPIPADFNGWATNPLTIDDYTTSTANATINLEVRSTNGTLEAGSSFASITPGTANTWSTSTTSTLANTYSANGTMTIRLRMSAANSASVRVGTITLKYLSSF